MSQSNLNQSQNEEEVLTSDDESSDSESDDDEASPSHRIRKPLSSTGSASSQSNKGNVRRSSICAEKMSICSTMNSSEIKSIPKTVEEAERIQHILKKNVLFQHLDEQQLLTVQNAMFLVEKENDDVIIQQGDDGDNFYILDRGHVNVFIDPKWKKSADNKGDETGNENKQNEKGQKIITKYSDGDSFGELAIMYNAPRAASCIAEGSVRLWALDRASFKVILLQTTMEKRNKHKEFLQQVSLFSEMTNYEVLTLVDALQEVSFEEGETICAEGDKGDKFYIIEEGKAICLKKNSTTGENVQVAALSNGSYFGEVRSFTYP